MPIYFYGCVSMDGYLADKDHKIDWLLETGTTEETNYDAFYKRMDITVMGKRTFDDIADMDGIESFYGTTENYVFTHADSLSVKNFIPISGNVVERIKNMPQDKNIWIVGGNTILAELLDHDMIDEFYVQVAPVLLGDGIPLFTQKEGVKRFKLKEVHQFGPFAEMVFEK
ncbi:dihydrofolate reductase family protein [Listeria aquatica]|uniref:dihydrofolate reductase family protein n=1 Tax=Listeria aquatica TaxID=1494960 RepID=UPI0031F4D9F7